MNRGVKRIVHDYVSMIYDNVKIGKGKWDAEIARRKVYNLLVGLELSNDYSDTVIWNVGSGLVSTDREHDIIDQYIRLDIYKTTGISYSEYKQMTVKEKIMVLDYINYKSAVIQMQTDMIEANEEDNNGGSNSRLYDI